MKIYLLRHTSLDVGPDTFYGQTDLDVSKTFDKEVKVIKKKLNDEGVDIKKLKVISSPLKRCTKLTDRICGYYQTDDRIKEMNLGDWEMKDRNSIPGDLINEWENNLLNFKIPNGESNKVFLSRLNNFLQDVTRLGEDSLIVCHAGCINGMVSILTGESFDKLVKNYWEKIKYGSLTFIEIEKGKVLNKFLGK